MATSETNQTLLKYAMSQEEEHQLMKQYTNVLTRELVFAIDLMTFVMEESNLKFRHHYYPKSLSGRSGPVSDFDDVMKKFVRVATPKTVKPTRWSSLFHTGGTSINLCDTNYEEFKCFANACSTEHEARESGEFKFLMFCVVMAKMCSDAFSQGMTNAPKFGIMLMCRTYDMFHIKSSLTENPWQEMNAIAGPMTEVFECCDVPVAK